ncbi:MAG: porin family protein [Muribaculum sp.]|nr:porin family protein [Muribaculum sp.]
MKNLKVLFASALLAVSAPAFAQFANSGSSSSADTDGYNRVGISYENVNIDPKGGDGIGLNGFGISYIHGFSVSSTLPIFVETGLKYSAGFHSDSEGDYYDDDLEIKHTFMSLSVPVNVAYKFAVGEGMSIQPYLGLNLKLHLVGKEKYEYDGESESISVFDDDDMDGDAWKRFQLGWHIGAGFNYNKFYVGLSYGTDFIKIAKKVNTGTFSVGVGYNF